MGDDFRLTQLSIDLCLEVEKHPCLYDSSNGDYNKYHISKQIWDEIGAKLGCSGESCKKRWNNLRTAFVRQVKKNQTERGYYLSKYMAFLVPHLKTVTTKRATYQEESATSDHEQEQSESSDWEVDQICTKEEYLEDSPILSFNEVIENHAQESNSNITMPTSKRQFPKSDKTKKQKIADETENPRRYFLLSLLPELEELPETQFRQFKRKVLGLIDDLETSRPTTSIIEHNLTGHNNSGSDPLD